ncbi:enolase C-terminal domain-like protein [Streptomyces sp. NPDC057072]|uniref:enolase C-terminal domain-like protein n=1 Tax=unclassified Streptomyces TaxID=2593676 RepID=UPI00362C6E1C
MIVRHEGGTTPAIGSTVQEISARAVLLPVVPPMQTAAGEAHTMPLVLIDLTTSAGTTGRAYLIAYTPLVLTPLAQLVTELGETIIGTPVAPVDVDADLRSRLRLLRPQGLATMAISGIDIALWDALAKAVGLPLAHLLGGGTHAIPAYASLKSMHPLAAGDEATRLATQGFGAYKIKLSLGDLRDDLKVVETVRAAVGEQARLALDYNQSLSVPEATHRIRALAQETPLWIEEPTRAEDFAGHARIRAQVPVPIQIGESWWSTDDMAASIAAGASDYAMPDVTRIGGVTGWLRATALADAAGLPISSHLLPQVNVHLLAVSPGAHLLEFLDLAAPVLQEPATVVDGAMAVPDTPGIGIDWDEGAIARYAV